MKNFTIIKLCEIIKEVEGYLTQFKFKVSVDINNKLKLRDFGDFGFTLLKDMKIVPKHKEPPSEDAVDNLELRMKNSLLEDEFNQLKNIHKDLIYKWEEGNMKIAKLEQEKVLLL